MLTSPTTTSWIRASPIETLVTRACDPSLHEPNYAIHLEVAEYINTKKANKYVYNFQSRVLQSHPSKSSRSRYASRSTSQPSKSTHRYPSSRFARHFSEVMRIPLSSTNLDKGIPERTCPSLPRTATSIPRPSNVPHTRTDS